MKIRPKKNKGQIKLSHGQSIKQSHNYQSADATYYAELTVSNDPASIKKGLAQLETLVETALGQKVMQQQRFLLGLSDENKGSSTVRRTH